MHPASTIVIVSPMMHTTATFIVHICFTYLFVQLYKVKYLNYQVYSVIVAIDSESDVDEKQE